MSDELDASIVMRDPLIAAQSGRPHKAMLLSLIDYAHDLRMAWMAGLSDQDRSAAPNSDNWGARAILAHLAHWNLALLRAVDMHARGESVPFQWQDMHAQTAQVLAASAGREWAETAAEAEQAFDALRVWAERLTQEELDAGDDFAWQTDDPLWVSFLGNIYFHYLEHLAANYDAAGQPEQAAALQSKMAEVDGLVKLATRK